MPVASCGKKKRFSICAVCVDITDKKKEELEKSAQTEMLKLVAQGSDELLFSYTVEDDSMHISKYMDGTTITVLMIKILLQILLSVS